MSGVKKRTCCASFPGQAHTRVCEARTMRPADLPRAAIVVLGCSAPHCRVVTFDATLMGGKIANLPCPACGHHGRERT